MKLLLDKEAYIEAADNDGITALICATRRGSLDVVKLLLDEGADIEAADETGATSLIHALWINEFESVKLFLDSGADIQARDHLEKTVLYTAIEFGSWQVVKLLLEMGAGVEAAQIDGKTSPLTVAVELSLQAAHPGSNSTASKRSDRDMITGILLKYGADPTMRDEHGKTPLELVPEEYTEMRALLEAAEAAWTSSHSLQAP